ncbi:MAG TPA: MCE family protein [candidate division Zixibacteria bacterium]|nr:MCE family protein [candidate division Zixibacteria bacterium]
MTHRKKYTDRKIAVGGLITAALLLSLVAIIIISGQEGLLRSRYELRTRMDSVNGLQVGAPVWLAGVNVGTVSDIRFFHEKETGKTKIEVRMKIKKSVQDLIRADSRARIGTLGLLGDKYVAISLGSPDAPILKDKDYIQSTNPVDFEEMISRSIGVVDDITATVEHIKNVAEKTDKGVGTLGKLINEPALYFDLEDFFKSMEKLAKKVENNEGTVGLLFNDPSLYRNLDSALAEIAALADTLKSGNGTLKKLLRDPTLYDNMMASVARIDSLIKAIQEGEGTAGQLISNRELYDKLRSTAESLDSLIQEIKKHPSKYLKVKVSIF